MVLNFYQVKFEEEHYQSFIDAVNSDAEHITIYIRSNGGLTTICDFMVDIINSQPERFKIVAGSYIGSSAFIFYLKCNCSKKILPKTIAMIHQTSLSIDINEYGKPNNRYDKCMDLQQNLYVEESMSLIESLGLTEKEKKEYIKGEDIYFTYNRLLEVVKNYELKKLINTQIN